jgi:hypothetical protein
MPDPLRLLQAGGAAAATAFVVVLLCGWLWHSPSAAGRYVGGLFGAAAGFALGCWVLGPELHFDLRDVEDRLLLTLLPAALLVELFAALVRSPRWPAWALRLAFAAVAAPVLLYKTTFLAGLSSSGNGEWGRQETYLILGALAVALAVVWALLARLGERSPDSGPLLGLAVVCAAAAPAVMVSGYIGGGILAAPLAAALGGVGLALLAIPGPSRSDHLMSVGIIGLFSILLLGHFFGKLPTWIALVLFLAPLLLWVPAVPWLRGWRPWLRAALCLIFVAVPAALGAHRAIQIARANARPATSMEGGPSLDDYMSFRPSGGKKIKPGAGQFPTAGRVPAPPCRRRR